jgi:hypothetical protein
MWIKWSDTEISKPYKRKGSRRQTKKRRKEELNFQQVSVNSLRNVERLLKYRSSLMYVTWESPCRHPYGIFLAGVTAYTCENSLSWMSYYLKFSWGRHFYSWIPAIFGSTFGWDYLLHIALCILSEQSPRCYSQYKNIVCFVGLEVWKRKVFTAYNYTNIF